MRFVRYASRNQPPTTGWVFEDKIGPVEGSIFGEFQRKEAEIPLEQVRLLAPVLPSKILCVGRNYVAHAKENNAEVPEVPLLFLKPPSALIGYDDAIFLPPQSKQVEHEAELVVVIGAAAGFRLRMRWTLCSGIRPAWMSQPATCNAGMGSGRVARVSIHSVPSVRGSRLSSIPPMH